MIWRGKCASTPEAIRDALRKHAPALVRVGLETGLLSNWLTHSLRGMRRAKVAVARQLAVLLHRLWTRDEDFRWREPSALAAAPATPA